MDIIFNNSIWVLFIIISIGLIIGSINIKGFSLDISAIIIVSLAFGYLGFKIDKIFQEVGLVLFIFSVGFQAGPNFLSSFKNHGFKLILLCIIIKSISFLNSLVLIHLFNIDSNLGVGMFAGALTSTPGLAAAIDATASPLTSVGYGLAYPFGVLSVILFLNILPKLVKIDFNTSEQLFVNENNKLHQLDTLKSLMIHKTNVHKTIAELNLIKNNKIILVDIIRDRMHLFPTRDLILKENDIIIYKTFDNHTFLEIEGIEYVEINNLPDFQNYKIITVSILNLNFAFRKIKKIKQIKDFNCIILSIQRNNKLFIPDANNYFRPDDKITLYVHESKVDNIVKEFEKNNKTITTLALLPMSLTIGIGLMIGLAKLNFYNLHLSLGVTGGVLLSSLTLSALGKTWFIKWYIPNNTQNIIRQLGILLFLSGVGINAGSHIKEIFNEHGVILFVISFLINLIPMILATIIGLKFFKINFALFLGALTGSMTSTPGLAVIDGKSKTDAAVTGYSNVYPFALILMIVFAHLFMLF